MTRTRGAGDGLPVEPGNPPATPVRVALLSTSDTDLLCARGSGADYLLANPSRPGHTSMAGAIEAADIVVARILGGPQDLCDGFRRIRGAGATPLVVLGGEQAPERRAHGAVDGQPAGSWPRPTATSQRAVPTTCASCTPSSATRAHDR